MRSIITAILIVLILAASGATQGRYISTDNFAIQFVAFDSAGVPVILQSTDSVYVIVNEPDGDSIYSAGMEASNAAIKTINIDDITGHLYTYTATISTLLNGRTTAGIYGIAVIVNDISLDELASITRGSFYYVGTSDPLANLDVAVSTRSTLGTSDNIGVNLDDVTGTLDNAEIGTDFLTASKIGAGAITASEAPALGNLDAAVSTRGTSDFDYTSQGVIVGSVNTSAIEPGDFSSPPTVNVNTIGAGAITSGSFAASAIDATAVAVDAIGASELATDAVAEIEAAVYANRADYMASVAALATASELAIVKAMLDSSMVFESYRPGCYTRFAAGADWDTLYIYTEDSTLYCMMVMDHEGGQIGDAPDTVTNIGP